MSGNNDDFVIHSFLKVTTKITLFPNIEKKTAEKVIDKKLWWKLTPMPGKGICIKMDAIREMDYIMYKKSQKLF
jgi:hypothetical protein